MDSSEVEGINKVRLLKTLTNFIYWLAIIVLVLIAAATAFSVSKAPGGYRAFVVQSGSMQPAIKAGSVVLVGPQKEYKKDDVITFLFNPKANLKDVKSTVTHRIAEVHSDEDQISFTTKGDANDSPDREKISEGQVLGQVLFSIPYLGHVVAFTKTQTGFIVLIVIPATLIIYSELASIKKEIQRLLLERKKKTRKK